MGPREKWPFALRSSLELCCGLRIPAAVYLGDQRGMFWNDAYVPIAGDKHPKRVSPYSRGGRHACTALAQC